MFVKGVIIVPVPPSGDVTLMFTDIESSTLKWDRYLDDFHEALTLHNDKLRLAIADHSGYEVKTIGDAFMVAFADPLQAVLCALDIQRAIETGPFEHVGGLRVRIGLHTGAMEPIGGDYFGPAVNRAARVGSAAHGGQILLSETTALGVEDRLPPGLCLMDMGFHGLKDLGAQQHLYLLTHPDLPSRDYPPLRTLNTLPHNFPAQVTEFVGRDREIKEIKGLIHRGKSRLITLSGIGGTGKTRLAVQVAADISQHYPDGVWMVDLSGVSDPREVPIAMALALGTGSQAAADARAQVTAFLREKRCLLLLDNFEQVVEAARFVGELMRACPYVVFLVTSRQILQITGETEYPIAPMDLPPANASLESCRRYASVSLFVERCVSANSRFELTHENVSVIVDICRCLEGIPLAMELTASLVRGMTPQQIRLRLNQRFRLLATTRRDLEPRQRSLRGAVDWSYDLLTEQERSLFVELAVFAGGFCLEDVEAVCTEHDTDSLSLLFSLRDKSLLKADEAFGQTRYGMLETLREYALEKLEAQGILPDLRSRHAAHFLRKAEALADSLNEDDGAMSRLTIDSDNMRVGMDTAIQRNDCTLTSAYGKALARFFLARGLYQEGDMRLSIAEDSCRSSGDLHMLAQLLLRRGNILVQSDLDKAQRLFQESYDISKQLNDLPRMAPALINLGKVATLESNYDLARSRYEEALALARQTHQPRYEAAVLPNLGILSGNLGDYEGALRFIDEGMELSRRENDQRSVAYAQMNSYEALLRLNRAEEARLRLGESRAAFARLGYRQEVALTHIFMAIVLTDEKRLDEAEREVEEGLRLAREIEDTLCLMYGLAAQGRIAGARGDLPTAFARFRQSVSLAEKVGAPNQIAGVLKEAGMALLENREEALAREVLTAAQKESAAQKLPEDADVKALLLRLGAGAGTGAEAVVFMQGDPQEILAIF